MSTAAPPAWQEAQQLGTQQAVWWRRARLTGVSLRGMRRRSASFMICSSSYTFSPRQSLQRESPHSALVPGLVSKLPALESRRRSVTASPGCVRGMPKRQRRKKNTVCHPSKPNVPKRHGVPPQTDPRHLSERNENKKKHGLPPQATGHNNKKTRAATPHGNRPNRQGPTRAATPANPSNLPKRHGLPPKQTQAPPEKQREKHRSPPQQTTSIL